MSAHPGYRPSCRPTAVSEEVWRLDHTSRNSGFRDEARFFWILFWSAYAGTECANNSPHTSVSCSGLICIWNHAPDFEGGLCLYFISTGAYCSEGFTGLFVHIEARQDAQLCAGIMPARRDEAWYLGILPLPKHHGRRCFILRYQSFQDSN